MLTVPCCDLYSRSRAYILLLQASCTQADQLSYAGILSFAMGVLEKSLHTSSRSGCCQLSSRALSSTIFRSVFQDGALSEKLVAP